MSSTRPLEEVDLRSACDERRRAQSKTPRPSCKRSSVERVGCRMHLVLPPMSLQHQQPAGVDRGFPFVRQTTYVQLYGISKSYAGMVAAWVSPYRNDGLVCLSVQRFQRRRQVNTMMFVHSFTRRRRSACVGQLGADMSPSASIK